MFVGHGLLALALVSTAAAWRGMGSRRALTLGLVAAGFATLPDFDVLYPLLATLAGAGSTGALADDFWRLSTTVHRGATHSLVVSLWTAVGVALWTVRGGFARESDTSTARGTPSTPGLWDARASLVATRTAAVGLLGGLVLTVGLVVGALPAATVGVMAVGAVAIATLATRADLGAREVGVAAVVGLSSHPFGDLFTGQPPPFLFPLDAVVPIQAPVVGSRIALHADPTLHLVGAFLAELATIWLAIAVVTLLLDRRPWRHVRPRALAGVGFAVAVLAIPAPSLSAATGFVAGALAVGVVGVPLRRRPSTDHCWDAAWTALVAVTLGVTSYGVAYALL